MFARVIQFLGEYADIDVRAQRMDLGKDVLQLAVDFAHTAFRRCESVQSCPLCLESGTGRTGGHLGVAIGFGCSKGCTLSIAPSLFERARISRTNRRFGVVAGAANWAGMPILQPLGKGASLG